MFLSLWYFIHLFFHVLLSKSISKWFTFVYIYKILSVCSKPNLMFRNIYATRRCSNLFVQFSKICFQLKQTKKRMVSILVLPKYKNTWSFIMQLKNNNVFNVFNIIWNANCTVTRIFPI